MKRGFSLVELSIVLVILGFLTGGILAGQSLIRAAEIRSVTSDLQRFMSASHTFRDKYLALPGDMREATRFWGFQGTAAAGSCVSNAGVSTVSASGTCDGDGDGSVEYAAVVQTNSTQEIFQFWRQLALSGLVEGTYTGIGVLDRRDADPGVNVPQSRISNAGYALDLRPVEQTVCWKDTYGNYYIFGTEAGNVPTQGKALRPEELWNIDVKMDDGKPAYGKVRSFFRYSYGNGDTCVTTNDETTTEYLLTSSAIGCNMMVHSGF